jgi:TM2 domain-containing membrane protein YozV
MGQMTPATTPAGWYGQSDGSERFWTGSQWTGQVRPRLPAASAPPPPAPTASEYAAPPPPQQGALVPVQPAPIGALANPRLAHTQQGYVAVSQVAPRSPGLALLASFFLPGLGQLVNGQVGKGIAMFVAYLVSLAMIFVFIGVVLAPAIWIWSMADAYSGAKQWNARHGILS